MTPKEGTILSRIESPADLKNLSEPEIVKLCQELREFILDVVSVHPGHLGSSLGVIELTVAVHKVFNTPYDRLIWDVGHQAYGHKILTGRRDQFYTNRQYKGIGGFPIRSESEYDAFGTGHASTSISAALGMAEASKLRGESDRKHIAIIGDGALTGGMAVEGMNNAGTTESDILIILNDNGISIDENVGSLKNYFSQMAGSTKYDLKKWKALGIAIKNADDLSKNKSSIKGKFQRKGNLFEAMNFAYFGPVDGHDVQGLIEVLNEIKGIPGPKLLHIITKKGKGFKKAEEAQTLYHAPCKFDRQTGEINSETKSKNSTYQEVYGKTLLELATSNDKIIGITPAMPTGSAMNYMRDKYPNRVFDVGIAEQHAVTFAAGIAAEGFKPFCTIYSTFLQRAYDQVIHDVALQKLPVVFAIDRAGLVGEDGATHHGVFDLAYMSTVPDMIVCAPMNEIELRNLMFTASTYKDGPIAIRYPRRKGTIQNWETDLEKVEIGKGRIVIEGNKVAILSIGYAGNIAMEAINKLNETDIFPSLIDMRFIAPLDTKLLHEVFENYDLIITVEDGIISGGLGSKVITFKNNNDFTTKIVTMGVPDKFIGHGNVESLYKESGYDTKSIVSNIKKYYSKIN